MTYDKWLELLKRLEKTSHEEDVNVLKNEPLNSNINGLLVPKIRDMIVEKFNNSLSRITENFEDILSDESELDLTLVTFRKNVLLVISLIENNQFSLEQKISLKKEIKDSVENTYKTLYDTALESGTDGVLNSIINKDKIKWSE